jgi:uncharacterized protein
MKHFLLIYVYVEGFREKRAPLRAAHLAHAKAAVAAGVLELGGALAEDDPRMGLLLFKGETAESAEAFARNDPYVSGAAGAAGIVESWRVREWVTVVGRFAAQSL